MTAFQLQRVFVFLGGDVNVVKRTGGRHTTWVLALLLSGAPHTLCFPTFCDPLEASHHELSPKEAVVNGPNCVTRTPHVRVTYHFDSSSAIRTSIELAARQGACSGQTFGHRFTNGLNAPLLI